MLQYRAAITGSSFLRSPSLAACKHGIQTTASTTASSSTFNQSGHQLLHKSDDNNDVNQRRFIAKSSVAKSNDSWFSKLLVRKIEPGKDSHSRLLTDSEAIYEMQFQDVKPDAMDSYLTSYEKFVNELKEKDPTYELVASFRVDVGDQDQIVNIWKYQKGYRGASKNQQLIREDPSLAALIKDQSKMVRQRNNQLMMAFSFWGHPTPQVRNANYEMRSYVLKPGTMIEWGNNWARGINFRTNKVGGFFGQIGQLYTVHHLWHYENLAGRKEVRENSWTKPGWDEIVAYTVPLIREMRSRWMSPNSFSPIR